MYSLEFRGRAEKSLKKLGKKNPQQLRIASKKVTEILKNPHRFKNLKRPLQNFRRVHVDKSFVLTYTINEKTKTVIIEDYAHHDNVYRWRPGT